MIDPTMISTSSFAPLEQSETEQQEDATADALLFPSFRHFRGLPPLSSPMPTGNVEELRHFVESELVHPSELSQEQAPSTATPQWISAPITNPTVLICSHGQRDSRCGVLGPVLHDEFQRYLAQRRKGDNGIYSDLVASPTKHFLAGPEEESRSENSTAVNIGMISHVGGHAWAGNVIIYIPPAVVLPAGGRSIAPESSNAPGTSLAAEGLRPKASPHPLAGMGVWYGRVEPRHVEGIVEQTLVKGNIIKELFRGALDVTGETAVL